MSTTARKARKKSINYFRSLEGFEKVVSTLAFQHIPKTPTPLGERRHLQERPIFGKGPNVQATRFGFTGPARRELLARGVDVA